MGDERSEAGEKGEGSGGGAFRAREEDGERWSPPPKTDADTHTHLRAVALPQLGRCRWHLCERSSARRRQQRRRRMHRGQLPTSASHCCCCCVPSCRHGRRCCRRCDGQSACGAGGASLDAGDSGGGRVRAPRSRAGLRFRRGGGEGRDVCVCVCKRESLCVSVCM
jgi:hypothetical protein